MKLNITLKNSCLAMAVAAVALLSGCQPDEIKSGNPLTESDLDAGFALTSSTDTIVKNPLQHNAKNFVFKASSVDPAIQYHTWRASDEKGEYQTSPNTTVVGPETYKFTFTASGTYKIEHRVVGRVGGTNFVSEQTVTVDLPAEPQKFGPNIITSPNFEKSSDWGVFNTGATQTVTWAFNAGSATASGGVDNVFAGQGIYQAIKVEAGTYRIDMHVDSPGASTNAWFQVFVGENQPANGSDYGSDPTVIIGLNTYAGCAKAAFTGQLSKVGCVGTGQDVTFTKAGTMYFVIKCGTGAANGVNNISASNITMNKFL